MRLEREFRSVMLLTQFASSFLGIGSIDRTAQPEPPTPRHNPYDIDWESLDLVPTSSVPQWEVPISIYADEYGVPRELVAAVMDKETQGRTEPPFDQSPGDGVCLMGIMPNDENNSFPNRPHAHVLLADHYQCIELGVKILAQVHKNQGAGDWYQTLLWYNAGLEEKLKYAVPYADDVYSKLNWPTPRLELREAILLRRPLPNSFTLLPESIRNVILNHPSLNKK